MLGLLPLAISIGILGGFATWLSFGPLSGIVVIWGIFITWGAFFHSGGDNAALRNTIVCSIFGAVLAGIALALVGAVPLGALTAPIWVGLLAFVLVMAASIPALSTIPVSVYGFAGTAAYALEHSGAASTTSLSLANPVVVMSLSFILGAIFGIVSSIVSGKLSGLLPSSK